MKQRSNAGFGVAFLIVMVVLVVLSIVGLGTKYLTRGATRTSEAVFASQGAVVVGRSALEEAWARLEGTINKPDEQVARWFACPPSAERKVPFQFVIPPTDVRAAVGLDGSVTVSDVTFLVPREYFVFSTSPLERTGFVLASVTVSEARPGLGATFTRTIRQWREYKVLFPVPPYPLGESSLFVFIPLHVTSCERQYRQLQTTVADSIKKQEDDINDQLKKLKKKKIKLPRPFADNQVVYRYFPDLRYPPFPFNARAPRPDSYDVSPPTDVTDMDNGLVCYDRELRAEHFKLRWPEKLQTPDDDWIMQQLQRDTASPDPRVVERTRALLASVSVHAAGDGEGGARQSLRNLEQLVVAAMAQYAARFRFTPEASWHRFVQRYFRYLMGAGPQGTIKVEQSILFNALWRCTHVFPNQATLWSALRDADGRVYLDGIYYVNGPVEVDMTYRGKGTIMGREHMVVKRCKKEIHGDPDSYCTLLSFCQTEAGATGCRSIELQADVDAGLVALPGLIKDLHLHSVFGSLALGLLNPELVDGRASADPGNDPQAGAPYPFSLTYDPALRLFDEGTGKLRLDRCRVVLSPNVVGTSVER